MSIQKDNGDIELFFYINSEIIEQEVVLNSVNNN